MAKRKNITRVPTWRAQWIALTEGGRIKGEEKRSARKTALGRRPAKERQEKKERWSRVCPLSLPSFSFFLSLSFRLSRDDGLQAKRRRCGFYAGEERTESEGREIEEEGFVAERDFQRSQLLDASRAAGGTTRYRVSSRCIDVREFREFRFPRHSTTHGFTALWTN